MSGSMPRSRCTLQNKTLLRPVSRPEQMLNLAISKKKSRDRNPEGTSFFEPFPAWYANLNWLNRAFCHYVRDESVCQLGFANKSSHSKWKLLCTQYTRKRIFWCSVWFHQRSHNRRECTSQTQKESVNSICAKYVFEVGIVRHNNTILCEMKC